MTAADEARDVEEVGGGDPLRRLVLGLLVLYLAPVILLVLLIGGLGMVCSAMLRLIEGGASGAEPLRHGPMRALPAPHVFRAARSRSPHHFR